MAAPVFQLYPDDGPPPAEQPNADFIWPSPNDPLQVARILIETATAEDQALLRRWRGTWMRYTGPAWTEAEDTEVRRWVYTQLEHAKYEKVDPNGTTRLVPWQPTKAKVSNVLDAIESLTHLPQTTDAPSWLDTGAPANDTIACANGLLDVRTRRLDEASPRYFGTVCVPFDYDPTAPEPVEWLKFLRSVWPRVAGPDGVLRDADELHALQEWFGYVLSGSTSLQKMAFLVGPPRSGKGTITKTLEALVGRGNACSPTLAGLGSNFGLQPLLGKALATIADARLGRDNVNIVVERLLSISGEDTLTVDRKHKEAWSGKVGARIMLCSNELPRFGDASGAIASRFILLTMTESFLGNEDTGLQNRIERELPGILLWALRGLERLHARHGRFTEPTASADAKRALADLVSPISAFLRDACRTGGEYAVIKADLFAEWKAWCEDQGHHPGSSSTFSANLRAVLPKLTDRRPRDAEGRLQPRQYNGVGLRPEWADEHAEDTFRVQRINRNLPFAERVQARPSSNMPGHGY